MLPLEAVLGICIFVIIIFIVIFNDPDDPGDWGMYA